MIEGTWHLVSGEQDGREIAAADIQHSKLQIVGNAHEATVGDGFLKGTHTLGTDQNPMTIDASDAEGPFAGKTLLGIFKLEDDLLTVCFAAPTNDRPTEFTTQGGKATILHAWKRDS